MITTLNEATIAFIDWWGAVIQRKAHLTKEAKFAREAFQAGFFAGERAGRAAQHITPNDTIRGDAA